MESEIHESAESAFLKFDHIGNNFFEQFPVELVSSNVLDQNFSSLISNLSNRKSQDILAFSHTYSSEFLGSSRWKELSNLYVEVRLRENTAPSSLPTMLAVLNDAEDAGFTPDQFGNFKFGFLEVTSRTLLDEGQIEFPAQIDIDLPVEVFKADLDTALSSPLADTSEYLIIFDVALAKTHRRVTGAKKQASKVLVGYKSAPRVQTHSNPIADERCEA